VLDECLFVGPFRPIFPSLHPCVVESAAECAGESIRLRIIKG